MTVFFKSHQLLSHQLLSRHLLSVFVLFGLVSLGACTTSSPSNDQIIEAQPIRAQLPDDIDDGSNNRFLTSINRSTLPKGTCGMVLWTLDANRPIPVLQYSQAENGELRLNNIPYELIRIDAQGDGAFGIFKNQTFAAGADIRVHVDLSFGQGFDGGTYLERGVIKVEQPDNLTLITPVAGIAGCRSK